MPLPVIRLLRALVAAVVVVTLAPAPSQAEAPIEGYPTYQPQSRCSPSAKPGTLALAEHLLTRYPGSGSSGISRSCGTSGTSEHKEGRAFDWRLHAGSERDRSYARDFLGRLLATDKHGNTNALARRMGIMYVIWNDQVWSSWDGYQRRAYLHPACSKRRTCGASLRHRDHMHISLTRAAARGKTSWYAKRVQQQESEPKKPRTSSKPTRSADRPAARRGVLDLSRRGYAKVTVPVTGQPVKTRFKLAKGSTYTITAAGLYSYGGPSQAADAGCTWSSSAGTWTSRPSARITRKHGRLELLVNGRRLFGSQCRSGSHTYRARFTATAERPLTLNVPVRHRRATGALTVVVSRGPAKSRPALPTYPRLSPAPAAESSPPSGYGLVTETVAVDPRRAARTARALQKDARYRVTVTGSARLGKGVVSDGQCVSVRGRWYRRASIDLRAPGADHGNLYLNGVPFEGRPLSGSGCSTRGYTADITAPVSGRLRLDLWDPLDRRDNSGALSVRVQRLTSFASPRAAKRAKPRARAAAWKQARDWFEVRSDAPAGTVSTMRLRRGERVQVIVRGTHRSHGRVADAACVLGDKGWARKDRANALAQDPLELWVDGKAVSWRSIGKTGVCSEAEHSYAVRFTARKHGPLRLAVLDLDHRDNSGLFSVTLLRDKR